VPPTGAKGLNLAVADVTVLATALIRLLRHGQPDLSNAYSDICQERVWRASYLSWWMTSMLHVLPSQDPFDSALQIAQLRNLTTSRAAATMLAESYTGGTLHFDPSANVSPTALLSAGNASALPRLASHARAGHDQGGRKPGGSSDMCVQPHSAYGCSTEHVG
jgi:hypothetical protein